MPRKNPFSPASGILELNPASFPRLYQTGSTSPQQNDQENDAAAANRMNGGEAAAADGESDAVAKPRRSSRRTKLPPVKLEYEEETAVKREPHEAVAVKAEAADDSSNDDGGKAMKVESDVPKDAPSAASVAADGSHGAPPADLENSPYPPPTREGPAHWREVYTGIAHMRSDYSAPVDASGCERQEYSVDPRHVRFQKLVGLMLSAQTKDAVTDWAVRSLDTHWREQGGLTVANILTADEQLIDRLICKVGFHTRKANFILRTARILRAHYDDDIPRTIPLLCSLPGVGPKMAYLAMQCAWHDNVGIGVDVHVHRIANRLGWASSVEAEETRSQMEGWMPQHLWPVINKLLVGFGQQLCLPTTPKCQQCAVNSYCPVGVVNVKRMARGLTPVKESKDEARVAAMKRAKKGGKRFTPVKYAKHDETQLAGSPGGSGVKKEEKEGQEAEEQEERNAEIVAQQGSEQEERKAEEVADAMEARAESMEATAETTGKSTGQAKRKSVSSKSKRGKKSQAVEVEADEDKDDASGASAPSTRTTRARGRRLEL